MATQPHPGGPASDHIQALAEDIVNHIQGEPQRVEDAAQSTGRVINTNTRKQSLAGEVAAKIRAVMPSPAEGTVPQQPLPSPAEAAHKAK